MNQPKRFGAWLRQQAGRQDPVGDLADDYIARCPCPVCAGQRRPQTVEGIRAHLDAHSACDGAYEALDKAIDEWGSGHG
jgi:hypothetical protein